MRFFLILLFLCGTVAGQATLLGVSAFQTCTQTSFAGASLNCSDTQGRVTVLDLLVEPLAGPPRTSFVINLSTLPPNSGTTQYDTTEGCVAPNADGRCLVPDQTVFTVTTTRPVLSYDLRPLVSSVSFPFAVPWADYYINSLKKYSGALDTDRCVFRRTYSSVNGGLAPTNSTVKKVFDDATLNAARIRCDPVNGTAPSDVAGQCNNALVYKLECYRPKSGSTFTDAATDALGGTVPLIKAGDATLTAQFCNLAPMCVAYQIINPPAVVGEITVSAYNARRGNITIVLQNFGAGSSKSDPAGLLLVRVEAAVSVDAFYGPNMRGVIVVCTDDDSQMINMSPDGSEPFVNPWKLAQEAGLLDPAYKLPVSEILKLVSGRDCGPHCMWYFIPPRLAQALGSTCGKYGVSPSIYGFLPDELFIKYFASVGRENIIGIPLADLAKISNVLTCVPGFGFEYLGLKSTTACSANSYFRQIMGNPLYTKPKNMPPGWDPQNPQQWLANGRLFYDLASELSSFELIIQTSGEFVGVQTTVVKGSIDQDFSSCWIDLSVSPPNGTIFLRVCNDGVDRGTRDNDASFNVITTCSAGLSPVGNLFTPVIAPQTCVVVTISVITTAVTIPDTASCKSTVYAAGSTVDPRSVVMETVELGCIVQAALPPPQTRAINITRLSPPVQTPPANPAKTGQGTTVAWVWFGIVFGVLFIVGVLLVGTLIFQAKSK